MKRKKIDPDVTSEKNGTILHEACYEGDVPIIKYLVGKSQQNLKNVDYDGNTPLHEACRNHSITPEMIRYILTFDSLYFCPNNSGFTPLHIAVKNKNYFLAFCLMRKLRPTNDQHLLHLLFESQHKNTQFLQFFLKESPFLPDEIDETGKTVFQKVCTSGDTNSVKYFIDHHYFDPKQLPEIIHDTIFAGQESVVIIFATCFKDYFLKVIENNEKTLTTLFDKFPLNGVHKILLQLNILSVIDFENNTVLHLACSAGNLDLIQELVSEYKLNPMQPNVKGNTPLSNACCNGHINCVKYIIEYSENMDNLSYKAEDTFLLFAASKSRNVDLLKYLVDKGCPYKLHYLGNSLLHVVCENKDILMSQYLVNDLHLDPAEKNDEGITPLEIACRKNCLQIVKFLVEIHEM